MTNKFEFPNQLTITSIEDDSYRVLLTLKKVESEVGFYTEIGQRDQVTFTQQEIESRDSGDPLFRLEIGQ